MQTYIPDQSHIRPSRQNHDAHHLTSHHDDTQKVKSKGSKNIVKQTLSKAMPCKKYSTESFQNMEKQLRSYIDENVEDLKNQLNQLHDRFVTDSANGKVTMQFLGQSITYTESDIKGHFIEMLGTVE